MEIENKVYTIVEMKEREIFTADYSFMDAPCTVTGTLVLKAQARGKMLRLFFRLKDGSKIITVVYWWQKYLGFYEQPIGSTFLLRCVKNSKDGIHLDSAEPVGRGTGDARGLGPPQSLPALWGKDEQENERSFCRWTEAERCRLCEDAASIGFVLPQNQAAIAERGNFPCNPFKKDKKGLILCEKEAQQSTFA